MAYLIVLVVDNPPHDAGDVISWRPEGTKSFGVKMLQHPWFRVIHCPEMSDEDADALLAPEPGDPLKNPDLRVRAFKLDLTALVGEQKQTIEATKAPLETKYDVRSGEPVTPEDLVLSGKDIESLKVLKPAIETAIGEEETVIG